jgi:predicted transglutaminase-like cysteine proteinase
MHEPASSTMLCPICDDYWINEKRSLEKAGISAAHLKTSSNHGLALPLA